MYLLSIHDRLDAEGQKKGASRIPDFIPCGFLLWGWDKGEANLNSTWATCQRNILIATSQFCFTFTRYCVSLRPFYYTGRSRFRPGLHSWRTWRKSNKKLPFKTAFFIRDADLTTSYYVAYDYTTSGFTDM